MPVHVLEDLKLLNLELLKYQFLLNSSQQRSVHLSVYVQIVNILGFANHRVSITIQLAPPMQENSHTWYVNECFSEALFTKTVWGEGRSLSVSYQFQKHHLQNPPKKLPVGMFDETDKLILKLTWKGKQLRRAKTTLKNDNDGDLPLFHFKSYYEAAVIKPT